MAALTESEFKATMGDPMALVAPNDDFRPIPLVDFRTFGLGATTVGSN